MFQVFAPVPLIEHARRWGLRTQEHYPNVFGYSAFGDLFVCSSDERMTGVILTSVPTLEQLNPESISAFKSEFLSNPGIVEQVLRQSDYEQLVSALGNVKPDECFFPVPLPQLGGSGALATFDKGNIWTHLDLLGQVLGLPA